MHSSSKFVVYHRIIAEIDYQGMEAVLKPADEGVEVPIDRSAAQACGPGV